MKELIILLSVLLILFSCKKSKPFDIPCTLTRDSILVKKYIKGTWEWVEGKRYNQVSGKFIYQTPRTEGYVVRMIISDSLLSLFVNANRTDYKYKILQWGEITGTNLMFSDGFKPTLVAYRISDGVRDIKVPIKICNEYLYEESSYVQADNVHSIWKKL